MQAGAIADVPGGFESAGSDPHGARLAFLISVGIVAGELSGTKDQMWLPLAPPLVVEVFEVEFLIFDMPNYGDMRIELAGDVGWQPDFRQWGEPPRGR